MAFGAELFNGKNSSIIVAGEKHYQYVGKKTIYVPSNGRRSVNLFNIRSNWDRLILVNCHNPHGTGDEETFEVTIKVNKNGTLRMENFDDTDWRFDRATITAYCFVESRYIPKPSYGLAIYNNDGSIAFSTARPPLRIKTTVNTSASRKELTGIKKPAGFMVYGGWVWDRDYGSGDDEVFYSTVWGLANSRDAYPNTYYQSTYTYEFYDDGPAEYNYTGYYGIPIIEGRDYDKFNNMPDFAAPREGEIMEMGITEEMLNTKYRG